MQMLNEAKKCWVINGRRVGSVVGKPSAMRV